ncbi:MAG: hypothetical protein NWQ54_08625, partial [Paraglaciecola sp.]|nr:hypothetical protein [Paraglaciecola sp.]
GQKCWEMRTTKFKKLGYIALVEKGTKTITGIARIDGYTEPLSLAQLEQHEAKHRVPKSQYTASGYKWFTAMKLSNVQRLSSPIRYIHNNGTVIWVKLSEQPAVLASLSAQLIKLAHITKPLLEQKQKKKKLKVKPNNNVIHVSGSKAWLKELVQQQPLLADKQGLLPLSQLGHCFSAARCCLDGLYHLRCGEVEYRFDNQRDALSALRRDDALQWAWFSKNGRKTWQNTAAWQAEE